MIFILAGTHAEALDCARNHMLTLDEWSYVYDYSRLVDVDDVVVWLYGTHYDREDNLMILDLCRYKGLHLLHVR